MKTVLGVEDGLAIAQIVPMQYYVRSGDFVSLNYKGVIGWTASDVPHDLQWGLDQLKKEAGAEKVLNQPTLLEIENGGSYVLV